MFRRIKDTGKALPTLPYVILVTHMQGRQNSCFYLCRDRQASNQGTERAR